MNIMNNNKKNCELMQDLLPLYADGVCSEQSKKIVNEHLTVCKECRATLDKLNQKVALAADTDISAIRKIRKRLFIGKAAALITAAVLLAGGLFGGYIWAVTDCSMDYSKYNLADNIHVEEDAEGNLWLRLSGNASLLSAFAYPTISDTDGGHMGYDDQSFDKEKKSGFGITLKMFRIAQLVPWKTDSGEKWIKVRNDLDYVFYYDDKTNTEYVLWGEKPNT